MSEPLRDTIFALSSGRPPAAIAVVRISGPRAGDALTALGVKIPEPRKAVLARLRDPATAEIIDEALGLWFPGPNSETGEDTAELQLHGGPAVIAATLAALGRIEGLRPAEAGEFTRRAFENGKLDLTAVEGLADLVSAETEGQRRQAFRQMKGLLGGRTEAWRQRLIQALALVEARIDFSDEADVPEDLVAPALTIARELAGEIEAALADGHRGERLREGLVVAIAGPPNAGKSTLLNRIARRDVAIVSPYAGTTRDVIEVHLDLDGWPVTLLDTAGIRETSDPIELEGVRRARDRAAGADLVLWVEDAGAAQAAGLTGATAGKPASDIDATRHAPAPGLTPQSSGQQTIWIVRNKIDLLGRAAESRETPVGSRDRMSGPLDAAHRSDLGEPRDSQKLALNQSDTRSDPQLSSYRSSEPDFETSKLLKTMDNNPLTDRSESQSQVNRSLTDMASEALTQRSEPTSARTELVFDISTVTGTGFEALLAQLEQYAGSALAGAEPALVTRQRHRRILEDAVAALHRAVSDKVRGQEDLLAEEFRIAAHALGRLTGRVDVEDILDVIFRDFCIGK